MENIAFLSMRSTYFYIGIRLMKKIDSGIRIPVRCSHPNIPDQDKLYMLEILLPDKIDINNYKPYDIYKKIKDSEYILPFIGTITY